MSSLPLCQKLGSQCQQPDVTLRIGSLDESPESLDHEATWLLGHTQYISFGRLRGWAGDLLVDAVLHVRCRYLKPGDTPGEGRCSLLGHIGPMPQRTRGADQPRQLGGD